MWEDYLEEKSERARIERAEADLEFFQTRFIRILKKYKLYDANIWLHQVEAILDPKEMVEVRHELIVRRQQLRKQIEYNTEIAKKAGDEIKEISKEYPNYAKEILEQVDQFGF